MLTCPHCGELHPDEARFCPASGQSIQPPTATERVRPLGEQKGVFDLFQEAATLYRAHTGNFLGAAAVPFVLGSFLASGAFAALAPTMGVTPDGAPATGGTMLGAAAAALISLLLYGLVMPLTLAALTVATADGLLGGGGDWRQHLAMLKSRLPGLMTALLPAALLIGVGFLLVVPGIILLLIFSMVPMVALVERKSGAEALKRSYELVRSDWLRTFLLLLILAIMNLVAHHAAGLFLPRFSLLARLLGDLLVLVVLPVPLIALVLLYFDVRRKQDGLDDEHWKAELETLRPVV